MPKKKRDKVFIWPTWITKLVAGEDQCEWKSWFKAHYMYDKKPSDFNLAKWTVNHQQLLKQRRDALERLGFKVYIEDQNAFKLNISVPVKKAESDLLTPAIKSYGEKLDFIEFTISGKADIVAIGEEEDEKITGVMHSTNVVEDCKTGSCKTSDHIQVMLYMMLLPKAIEKYKGMEFSGCIVYKLGVPNVDIPIEAAQDESLKKIIWDTMKQIAGDEAECRKVPSKKECGWCDIPCGDCLERIE